MAGQSRYALAVVEVPNTLRCNAFPQANDTLIAALRG
jgi:hypothetical protein